jgi:hypothetical protein
VGPLALGVLHQRVARHVALLRSPRRPSAADLDPCLRHVHRTGQARSAGSLCLSRWSPISRRRHPVGTLREREDLVPRSGANLGAVDHARGRDGVPPR